MPALTLEAVYRSLKRGEPATVYYLTGDADVLKEELVKEIIRVGVDDASRDFNVDIRAAGDVDGEALHALVETPPMLAERRVVVLKNLEQWRANAAIWQVLFRYLERPSPTTLLVLTHGSGEKPHARIVSLATQVEVDTLSPDQLRRWVVKRAQKAGIELAPGAAEHLIIAVGGDLGSLTMEIEKLAAATPVGTPVTLERVSELAGVRRGETLVDWVEAVLRRDAVAAIGLLDVVLPQPGVNGVRMVTALGTALLGTRAARALADGGASPRDAGDQLFGFLKQARPQGLGLWSEETRRWVRAASGWTGQELDAALEAVYQADRALKTTTLTDERGVLAALLLRIARRRPSLKTGAAA
ncbi:MAG: DNA polymerase III subunit delta [Gemmatimonadetes bacterium]|nr:DNA polymerase III subunit delta [Gemmatimonadota bacterium]